MEDLLSSIYGPLGIMAANDHTSAQAITDIIMSCLIMFTRDILITVIISSTAKQAPDAFLDSVLAVIKKEILDSSIPEDKDFNEFLLMEFPTVLCEQYAKELAIEFFKFNCTNIDSYLDYLRRVSGAEGNLEKEQEINLFESGTIETRFDMFMQKRSSNG